MLYALFIFLTGLCNANSGVKAIYLQSIEFNTFCSIPSPNFYIQAKTFGEDAETAEFNLHVTFPSDLELHKRYEINTGLLVWKYQIQDYNLEYLDLSIFHHERFESDPLITKVQINWSQLPTSAKGSPMYQRVAGTSQRSVCATDNQQDEIVMWLWADDASDAVVDSNGRIVTNTKGNESDTETWQITLVICLSVAVVILALSIPVFFCWTSNEKDSWEDSAPLAKRKRHHYDYDYGDGNPYDEDNDGYGERDYRGEQDRERHDRERHYRERDTGHKRYPQETFDEVGENYSHYSYSQVSAPRSNEAPRVLNLNEMRYRLARTDEGYSVNPSTQPPTNPPVQTQPVQQQIIQSQPQVIHQQQQPQIIQSQPQIIQSQPQIIQSQPQVIHQQQQPQIIHQQQPQQIIQSQPQIIHQQQQPNQQIVYTQPSTGFGPPGTIISAASSNQHSYVSHPGSQVISLASGPSQTSYVLQTQPSQQIVQRQIVTQPRVVTTQPQVVTAQPQVVTTQQPRTTTYIVQNQL